MIVPPGEPQPGDIIRASWANKVSDSIEHLHPGTQRADVGSILTVGPNDKYKWRHYDHVDGMLAQHRVAGTGSTTHVHPGLAMLGQRPSMLENISNGQRVGLNCVAINQGTLPGGITNRAIPAWECITSNPDEQVGFFSAFREANVSTSYVAATVSLHGSSLRNWAMGFIYAGNTDGHSTDVNLDDPLIVFRLQDSSSTMEAVIQAGDGSNSSPANEGTISTAIPQTFMISWNSSRVEWWWNGNNVRSVLHSIPASHENMIPFIYIASTTNAEKQMYVYSFDAWNG